MKQILQNPAQPQPVVSAPLKGRARRPANQKTPLSFLQNHSVEPGLCLPGHPLFDAGIVWLSNISQMPPQDVAGWSKNLSSGSVLAPARAWLFAPKTSREQWIDMLQDAPDLSKLAPDVLCDPGLIVPPVVEDLDTFEKITKYCERQVSRPAADNEYGGAAWTARLVLESFDISLNRHALALLRIRENYPQIFALIIGDQAWDAIDAARIAADTKCDEIVRAIIRQWLLNRAFHMQRGFAYVAASARSATPSPLRSILGTPDVTAAAAGAWVERLATDTSRELNGYRRFLASGGQASTPGCTSKPIDFVDAAFTHLEGTASEETKARARKIAKNNHTALQSIVPTIVGIKTRRVAEGRRAKASLHFAAGFSNQDRRKLTMFEIWHHGLNPSAMLLMLAARYCRAVAIAGTIIETPNMALAGRASDFPFHPSRAAALKIAEKVAAEIIPDTTPSFSNADKNFRLGSVCIRRNRTGAPVRPSRKMERQMYECLDPLFNALPCYLRHSSRNL